ncbi:MAG: hypothetical protein M4579_003114 [Chaenotheca gracillima]|nr:MAG: hypothetical protein M4579_003114 [Chaenotheca gracillima]
MSKSTIAAETELEICGRLAEASPSNPQSEHVVVLQDSFIHVGPNGRHTCLVYEPMGGTVASTAAKLPSNQRINRSKGERTRYPTWMAKRILTDVLGALIFLHQNGVVHGDVHPGNLLFSARKIDSIDEKKLEQPKSKITAPLQRLDGKIDKWSPQYLMLAESLYKYANLGPEMTIKLSDFGAAFWATKPPKKTVTPVALRAPELIFGEPFDSSIDIWSFGCLVYELLTGDMLFGVWKMGDDSQEDADDDHLLELNDVLEPLPDSWLAKWLWASMWFGPDRERLNPRGDTGGIDEIMVFDEVMVYDDEHDDDSSQVSMERGIGGSDDEDAGISPGDGDERDADVKVAHRERVIIHGNNELNLLEETQGPFINERLEVLFEKGKPADMPAEEAQAVISLLRLILRYNPSERPTAAQILEHEWFQKELQVKHSNRRKRSRS